MGNQGRNHENGNAEGSEANNFKIVMEQHNRKGEFKNTNQIA
jgi:hypothetical protein